MPNCRNHKFVPGVPPGNHTFSIRRIVNLLPSVRLFYSYFIIGYLYIFLVIFYTSRAFVSRTLAHRLERYPGRSWESNRNFGETTHHSVNLKIITRLRISLTFSENCMLSFILKLQIDSTQGVEVHKNPRHNSHPSVALNGGRRMLRAQEALWLDWLLF